MGVVGKMGSPVARWVPTNTPIAWFGQWFSERPEVAESFALANPMNTRLMRLVS